MSTALATVKSLLPAEESIVERSAFAKDVVRSLTRSPVSLPVVEPLPVEQAVHAIQRFLADSRDTKERARVWKFLGETAAAATLTDPARHGAAMGRLLERRLVQPSSLALQLHKSLVDAMPLGIRRSHIMEAVAAPDGIRLFSPGRDSLMLMTKAHHGKHASTLLLLASVESEKLIVQFALRAYHALLAISEQTGPYEVLQAVVRRYGLDFLVNRSQSTRYLERTTFDAFDMFTPTTPGKPLQSYAFVRPMADGITEVVLAFVVDMHRYAQDVAKMRS